MARIQPVLTEAEDALVSQMAALTRTKRSEVINNRKSRTGRGSSGSRE